MTKTLTPAAEKLVAELRAGGADDSNPAIQAIMGDAKNFVATVVPMTAAAKRATSPVKVSKGTKAVAKAMKPADASPKAAAKVTVAKPAVAPKAKSGNTFTSVDIATEHGISAKTLRARIRRHIDLWAPLFKDGERHVYADNAATRKAIAALLKVE